MSVRKIKDWWWIDFRHERKRYRRKSPANNRGAALAYEAKLRQLLAHDQPLLPKAVKAAPTFAQFADEWFRVDVLPNNKHSEQRSKHSTLRRQLLPFFGRMLVTEIGMVQVERFKAAKHRTGLSPKTINNYLATLGRALTCAEEWGVIPRRPKVRLLSLPPAIFDFLTPTESDALLAAAPNEYCRVAIRLALRTGMRLGELRGLPWDAVDLPNRTILVRQAVVRHRIVTPKSNRFRSIPISDDLAEALARVPHRSGFVLGRHDGSHPPSEETMRKILEQAIKRAKLRRLGWHALRHSFASQLVRAGVHIRVVQELLGHSDVQVTMRYTHVEPSRLRDAVNRLAEAGKNTNAPETRAFPEGVGTSWAPRVSFATHEIQRAQNDWALYGGPDGSRIGEEEKEDEANGSESSGS